MKNSNSLLPPSVLRISFTASLPQPGQLGRIHKQGKNRRREGPAFLSQQQYWNATSAHLASTKKIMLKTEAASAQDKCIKEPFLHIPLRLIIKIVFLTHEVEILLQVS